MYDLQLLLWCKSGLCSNGMLCNILNGKWLPLLRNSIFTGKADQEEFDCLTPKKMELVGCPEI
jgi:hypothetical protein